MGKQIPSINVRRSRRRIAHQLFLLLYATNVQEVYLKISILVLLRFKDKLLELHHVFTLFKSVEMDW